MKIQNAVNLDEVRLCAKARLPKIAFDFIDGGVHDEHGLATNRDAFRRY
jgi:(S)-mandelate dehydrogenase